MDNAGKKIIIGTAIATFLGLAGYLFSRFRGIGKLQITFGGLRMSKIISGRATLGVVLKVVNPSNAKFIISDQIYDIYINNVFVQRVYNQVPQNIEPLSTSNFQVNAQIDTVNLLQQLNTASGSTIGDKLRFLFRAKNQVLRIEGKFRVKVGVMPPIPLNFTLEDTLGNFKNPDSNTPANPTIATT